MQVTVVSLFLTGVGMTQFKIVTAGGGRDFSRPCSLIISWVSWIPGPAPAGISGIITSGYRQEASLNTPAIVYGFSDQNGHHGPSGAARLRE